MRGTEGVGGERDSISWEFLTSEQTRDTSNVRGMTAPTTIGMRPFRRESGQADRLEELMIPQRKRRFRAGPEREIKRERTE